MVVQCGECGRRYDDEFRWTLCPHRNLGEGPGEEETKVSENPTRDLLCRAGRPLLPDGEGNPARLAWWINPASPLYVHADDGTLCGPWCKPRDPRPIEQRILSALGPVARSAHDESAPGDPATGLPPLPGERMVRLVPGGVETARQAVYRDLGIKGQFLSFDSPRPTAFRCPLGHPVETEAIAEPPSFTAACRDIKGRRHVAVRASSPRETAILWAGAMKALEEDIVRENLPGEPGVVEPKHLGRIFEDQSIRNGVVRISAGHKGGKLSLRVYMRFDEETWRQRGPDSLSFSDVQIDREELVRALAFIEVKGG